MMLLPNDDHPISINTVNYEGEQLTQLHCHYVTINTATLPQIMSY